MQIKNDFFRSIWIKLFKNSKNVLSLDQIP